MDPRPPLTDPSQAPSPRPRRTRWLAWTAGIVGAVVAVGALLVVSALRRAEETIARHRARLPDEIAALAELPRVGPPLVETAVPGDAYSIVEAFLDSMEALPAEVRDWATTAPIAAVGWDGLLAKHPRPLEVLEPLATASATRRPPFRGFGESRTRPDRLYHASAWLAAATRRAIDKQDQVRAIRLALLEQALGREVASSGSMLDELTGGALERRGHRSLSKALEIADVSATSAQDMRRALERLDASRPPASHCLEMMRASVRDYALRFPDLHLQMEQGIGWRWLWSATIWRADMLDELDGELDGIARALSHADDDLPGTLSTLRARPPPDHPAFKGISAIWPMWAEARARTRAGNAAVRARLAVLEWTATKGAPPKSLDDLVPGILAEAPRDPWTGRELRYVDGKVWSVGKDGVDDRGEGDDVVAPPPPGETETDESGLDDDD